MIGKDVPLPLLEAIADAGADELRQGLARLRGAEFLYETSLFPDIEYTFTHALTHEVAYGSLLQGRRRAIHARVVDAFEKLFPDRVGERAHWLAHHAFRGEEWNRAFGYLKRTQTQTPATLDRYGLGGQESVGYLWWTGDYQHALTAGTRELAIASNFANLRLSVVANYRLGQIHHSLGDLPRAIGHLTRAASLLDRELLHDTCDLAGFPAVFTRAWLALCLAEQGEIAEARSVAAEAVTIAESAEHAYSLIISCFGLGSVHLAAGEVMDAIGVLERGLVLARMHDEAVPIPFLASPLGLAYALAGRAGDAFPLLDQAIDQAVAIQANANHARRLVHLGTGLRLSGRIEHARTVARSALDLARAQKERGDEAHALWLIAELAGDDDGSSAVEAAEPLYRRAIELADVLGMRLLLGRCRLGLAGTLRRAARATEADAERSAAKELLRAAGATAWLADRDEIARDRPRPAAA